MVVTLLSGLGFICNFSFVLEELLVVFYVGLSNEIIR